MYRGPAAGYLLRGAGHSSLAAGGYRTRDLGLPPKTAAGGWVGRNGGETGRIRREAPKDGADEK